MSEDQDGKSKLHAARDDSDRCASGRCRHATCFGFSTGYKAALEIAQVLGIKGAQAHLEAARRGYAQNWTAASSWDESVDGLHPGQAWEETVEIDGE